MSQNKFYYGNDKTDIEKITLTPTNNTVKGYTCFNSLGILSEFNDLELFPYYKDDENNNTYYVADYEVQNYDPIIPWSKKVSDLPYYYNGARLCPIALGSTPSFRNPLLYGCPSAEFDNFKFILGKFGCSTSDSSIVKVGRFISDESYTNNTTESYGIDIKPLVDSGGRTLGLTCRRILIKRPDASNAWFNITTTSESWAFYNSTDFGGIFPSRLFIFLQAGGGSGAGGGLFTVANDGGGGASGGSGLACLHLDEVGAYNSNAIKSNHTGNPILGWIILTGNTSYMGLQSNDGNDGNNSAVYCYSAGSETINNVTYKYRFDAGYLAKGGGKGKFGQGASATGGAGLTYSYFGWGSKYCADLVYSQAGVNVVNGTAGNSPSWVTKPYNDLTTTVHATMSAGGYTGGESRGGAGGGAASYFANGGKSGNDGDVHGYDGYYGSGAGGGRYLFVGGGNDGGNGGQGFFILFY